jgi:hypothetical protein
MHLIFVPEYKLDTAARDRRFVDGTLLYQVRVPHGFWEAKDEEDFISAVTRGRQTRFAVAAILFKLKYNRRLNGFVLSCQNAVEYLPAWRLAWRGFVPSESEMKEVKCQKASP